MIVEIIGLEVSIKTDSNRVRPEKSEVDRLYCDNDKLIEYTNWSPDYSLKSGLMETVEWFKTSSSIKNPELYHV